MSDVSGLRLGPPRLPVTPCPDSVAQSVLQKFHCVFTECWLLHSLTIFTWNKQEITLLIFNKMPELYIFLEILQEQTNHNLRFYSFKIKQCCSRATFLCQKTWTQVLGLTRALLNGMEWNINSVYKWHIHDVQWNMLCAFHSSSSEDQWTAAVQHTGTRSGFSSVHLVKGARKKISDKPRHVFDHCGQNWDARRKSTQIKCTSIFLWALLLFLGLSFPLLGLCYYWYRNVYWTYCYLFK